MTDNNDKKMIGVAYLCFGYSTHRDKGSESYVSGELELFTSSQFPFEEPDSEDYPEDYGNDLELKDSTASTGWGTVQIYNDDDVLGYWKLGGIKLFDILDGMKLGKSVMEIIDKRQSAHLFIRPKKGGLYHASLTLIKLYNSSSNEYEACLQGLVYTT